MNPEISTWRVKLIYLAGKIDGQPIRAEKTAGDKITIYLAGQPVKELAGSEQLKQLLVN